MPLTFDPGTAYVFLGSLLFIIVVLVVFGVAEWFRK